jgi:arabinogalactan oligomer / maltooligosaccharide transport system permease protein
MSKWLRENLWRHIVAVSVSLFALFPIYLVIISSINPTGSLQVTSFIPTSGSLTNFSRLFNDPAIPYLTWMKNSLIIAGTVAVLSVVVGAASAFACSR